VAQERECTPELGPSEPEEIDVKPFAVAAALVLSLILAGFIQAQTTPKDGNPGHLKMGLVSIKCLYSDGPDAEGNKANIQANLKRHIWFIDKLADQGVEFVGFPELSLNGYQFSKNMTWLSLTGPEVKSLQKKAVEKGIWISAGMAERDADGKKWNTHFVIGPKGEIIGKHHKITLTKEKGFTEAGSDHSVFEVKGARMGIAICADGTDRKNLQALVDNGAQIIYGPHANSTGGTTEGWYQFRSAWGGPDGWIAQLKVHAALHNHAGLYNPEFPPPTAKDAPGRWASGSWFIGPDGQTLAQMPASRQKSDSKEFVLICNVPIAGKR
jgi:predicted amidohydrolase